MWHKLSEMVAGLSMQDKEVFKTGNCKGRSISSTVFY